MNLKQPPIPKSHVEQFRREVTDALYAIERIRHIEHLNRPEHIWPQIQQLIEEVGRWQPRK